ncbi:MAG: hypothetical protein OHK0022_17600 [Roseiflexaceae bacterium]
MARRTRFWSGLLALMLAILAGASGTPRKAEAASAEVRCETIFSKDSPMTVTGTVYYSPNGAPGGIPGILQTKGTACPGPNPDSGWTVYFNLLRDTAVRISDQEVIDGVRHYTYNVKREQRDCVCTNFRVIGTATWQVKVPFYIVPRDQASFGIGDTIQVTRIGLTNLEVDLIPVYINLRMWEPNINQPQMSVVQATLTLPPRLSTWQYTIFPNCSPNETGWLCRVDVTIINPATTTTKVGLTDQNTEMPDGEVSWERTNANDTIRYRAWFQVVVGNTYYNLIYRQQGIGTCRQMVLSYVLSPLDAAAMDRWILQNPGQPLPSWRNFAKGSYALSGNVGGSRCHYNSASW